MAEEETTDRNELKGDELLRSVEERDMKDDVPHFDAGDTVEVELWIREAGKRRTQKFTGICIARKGSGSRETFTVRRMVQGEGVERIFPLHSPNIRNIKVVQEGKARRAKLFYLRQRTGKAAKVRQEFRKKQEMAGGEKEAEAKEEEPE